MSVGIHVGRTDSKSGTSLTDAIIESAKGPYRGMHTCQVFLHGPHSTQLTNFNREELVKICNSMHVYVHTTYATSWKDFRHLTDQIRVCSALPVKGLVVHIAKQRIDWVARKVSLMCNHVVSGSTMRITLEMRALKPDSETTYETAERLVQLVEYLKKFKLTSKQVGICIDTAHIYASKVPIRTFSEASVYLKKLEPIKAWIQLLHLNGNQFDATLRAGDKHTVPFMRNDKIWAGIQWEQSGCKAFACWYLANGKDVILEQDSSLPECKAFFHKLLKL